MAVNTYTQVGNREDLIGVVTRIAVEETPLLSSIGKTKATAVRHEWITDSLDAPAFNAEVEGSDVNYDPLATRVRNQNTCQILRKAGQITDTQQSAMKAGVKDEYANQLEKATKGLALDIERAHWQGAEDVGAIPSALVPAGAPRTSRGVLSFLQTNRVSMTNAAGADLVGVTPAAGGVSTITLAAGQVATVGDQILLTSGVGAGQYRIVSAVAGALTTVSEPWDVVPQAGVVPTNYIIYTAPVPLGEVELNDAIQSAKEVGGSPTTLYVGGRQKRAISGFASASRRTNDNSKTFTNTIDVYESDFGTMKVKYDRWTPEGVVGVIDESLFRTAWFRPIKAEEMPRSGSARNFMIEGEMCLESLGEQASAVVLGCSL